MNVVVPFLSAVYYKMNVMCARIFLKISARKKPVTVFPDSENKSIALKILNKRLYRLKRTNADCNINDRLCLYSGNRSTSNMLNVNRHRPAPRIALRCSIHFCAVISHSTECGKSATVPLFNPSILIFPLFEA